MIITQREQKCAVEHRAVAWKGTSTRRTQSAGERERRAKVVDAAVKVAGRQSDLARMMGVSRKCVSAWAKGELPVTDKRLEELKEIIG